MAAQARSTLSAKPKRFVEAERRRARSEDPEIALDLQLASIVARLEVDVMVVGDLDGAPVASAGDIDEAIDLAAFAAGLAKETPMRRAVTTTRGFVQIDLVDVCGRTFVVAAYAKHGTPCPVGVARAVAGAARILADGFTLGRAAPIPLKVLGGWGDWPKR